MKQRGPQLWWKQNYSHDKVVGPLCWSPVQSFDSCGPGWSYTGDTCDRVVGRVGGVPL